MNEPDLDVLLNQFIGDIADERLEALIAIVLQGGSTTFDRPRKRNGPMAAVTELPLYQSDPPGRKGDRHGLWIIVGAAAAVVFLLTLVAVNRHDDTTPADNSKLPRRHVALIGPDSLQVVNAINSVRTHKHTRARSDPENLNPLRANTMLMTVAQHWSEHMARLGRTVPMNVNAIAHPCWFSIGQNVGSGPSPTKVLQMFLSERIDASFGKERGNILNANYSDIGVGITKVGRTYWISQLFLQACASASPSSGSGHGGDTFGDQSSSTWTGRTHSSGPAEIPHPAGRLSPDEALVFQQLNESRRQRGVAALDPLTVTCYAQRFHDELLLAGPMSSATLRDSKDRWSSWFTVNEFQNGSLTQADVKTGTRRGRRLIVVDLVTPC